MVGFLSWLDFPGGTLTDSQTCIWLTVTLSLPLPLWMDHSFRLLLVLSTFVLSLCEFESQRQCPSSSLRWLQWEQTGVVTCGAENNCQPSCQPSDPIRSILFSLFGSLPPGVLFPSTFWPLCWRAPGQEKTHLEYGELQSCYQSGILFTITQFPHWPIAAHSKIEQWYSNR